MSAIRNILFTAVSSAIATAVAGIAFRKKEKAVEPNKSNKFFGRLKKNTLLQGDDTHFFI